MIFVFLTICELFTMAQACSNAVGYSEWSKRYSMCIQLIINANFYLQVWCQKVSSQQTPKLCHPQLQSVVGSVVPFRLSALAGDNGIDELQVCAPNVPLAIRVPRVLSPQAVEKKEQYRLHILQKILLITAGINKKSAHLTADERCPQTISLWLRAIQEVWSCHIADGATDRHTDLVFNIFLYSSKYKWHYRT